MHLPKFRDPAPLHNAKQYINFHWDTVCDLKTFCGFRARADVTAGGLLILLLCVARLHFALTDYREPPIMHQGMLWCDKWPSAKWRFVCLSTCQQRRQLIHKTGGGRARQCVSVWKKMVYHIVVLEDGEKECQRSSGALNASPSQLQTPNPSPSPTVWFRKTNQHLHPLFPDDDFFWQIKLMCSFNGLITWKYSKSYFLNR